MSHLILDPRALEEILQEAILQMREIRAVLLIDPNGLPLVSTLRAREFEDSLAAFSAAAQALIHRAREDFQMGPLRLLHLASHNRQIFLVPLTGQISLLGVAEAGANSLGIEIHLLALARSVLESIVESQAPSAQ